VESADFLYLKVQTGLAWGNLSSHITKLETAGYIQIEKKFIDRKPSFSLPTLDGQPSGFINNE